MAIIRQEPANPTDVYGRDLYIVYDAVGDEHHVYRVDALEMVRSGSYFLAPPGDPQLTLKTSSPRKVIAD
jgi:hypothetical protein